MLTRHLRRQDIVSGDEIISDVYDLKEAGDGAVYEVDCKMITLGTESFSQHIPSPPEPVF